MKNFKGENFAAMNLWVLGTMRLYTLYINISPKLHLKTKITYNFMVGEKEYFLESRVIKIKYFIGDKNISPSGIKNAFVYTLKPKFISRKFAKKLFESKNLAQSHCSKSSFKMYQHPIMNAIKLFLEIIFA